MADYAGYPTRHIVHVAHVDLTDSLTKAVANVQTGHVPDSGWLP